MDGLASYKIFKSGFQLFLVIAFLCFAIGLVIHSMSQNYISTSICNITENPDKSEILKYTVNNKEYTKNIPPATVRNNNVTTTTTTHQVGKCTLYYPSADPNSDSYGVNSNPTTMTLIMAGGLCLITIGMFLWFNFLKSNRNVAGVFGGIDAAQSVVGMFNRRRR